MPDSSEDTARAAREMAFVMPHAREWQDLLWSMVVRGKSGNVTLRVTVQDGTVSQVQKVSDGVGKKPQ